MASEEGSTVKVEVKREKLRQKSRQRGHIGDREGKIVRKLLSSGNLGSPIFGKALTKSWPFSLKNQGYT